MLFDQVAFDNIVRIAKICKDDLFKQRDYNAMRNGAKLVDLEHFKIVFEGKNLVRDSFKESSCIGLWDQATQMWITSNTADPTGTDPEPTSGIIYKATSSQLLNRIQENPYYLSWAIVDDDDYGNSPDGAWGSVSLMNASNNWMNRIVVRLNKDTSSEYIVEFELKMI